MNCAVRKSNTLLLNSLNSEMEVVRALRPYQACSLRPGPRPCGSPEDEKALLMKGAESAGGKKRSGRAEWQLRPCSAVGRDL